MASCATLVTMAMHMEEVNQLSDTKSPALTLTLPCSSQLMLHSTDL